MSKLGEGCTSLVLLRVNGRSRRQRCCAKRSGIFLKQWRCLGKDHPECPGFQVKSNEIEGEKP